MNCNTMPCLKFMKEHSSNTRQQGNNDWQLGGKGTFTKGCSKEAMLLQGRDGG